MGVRIRRSDLTKTIKGKERTKMNPIPLYMIAAAQRGDKLYADSNPHSRAGGGPRTTAGPDKKAKRKKRQASRRKNRG